MTESTKETGQKIIDLFVAQQETTRLVIAKEYQNLIRRYANQLPLDQFKKLINEFLTESMLSDEQRNELLKIIFKQV